MTAGAIGVPGYQLMTLLKHNDFKCINGEEKFENPIEEMIQGNYMLYLSTLEKEKSS
ncbi:hypothetical protein C1646_777351 [Rhizophagus diaphanus]|nr:hypothetical protein C1646_777351 [Rhizophagus diaphanus] [Rhizophagus sp. MUCL 43196]